MEVTQCLRRLTCGGYDAYVAIVVYGFKVYVGMQAHEYSSTGRGLARCHNQVIWVGIVKSDAGVSA